MILKKYQLIQELVLRKDKQDRWTFNQTYEEKREEQYK